MNPNDHRPDFNGEVLVVDDERSMRLAMTLALRTDGWDMVAATHAAEADQYFQEKMIQLVVLDYMLPETDGLALAQQWRRQGSQVPILLVSAQTDGPVVWRALKLGIIDMIAKPMEPEQLRRRVRAMLERPKVESGRDAQCRVAAGCRSLQLQQPVKALRTWDGLEVPGDQRGLMLLRAFALQLARLPGAQAALSAAGWPGSWHLSGGPDIFVEYCRRTADLLSVPGAPSAEGEFPSRQIPDLPVPNAGPLKS